MDVKEKVIGALFKALKPEYVRLEDDDGISGFVVSRQFEGISPLDRQGRIEDAVSNASLTQEERRQVLLIAGLTPEEYASVGARIRVHKVREMAGAHSKCCFMAACLMPSTSAGLLTAKRASRQRNQSLSAVRSAP